MRNTFNNNWYVPQFYGYCHKCNTYGHQIAYCKLMPRSPPSYESRNPFDALRNVYIICYHCNDVVHRIFECRRKVSQPYSNFPSLSFNGNVKYHHCQNFHHMAKHCKLREENQRKKMSPLEPKTKSNQNVTIDKKEIKLFLD